MLSGRFWSYSWFWEAFGVLLEPFRVVLWSLPGGFWVKLETLQCEVYRFIFEIVKFRLQKIKVNILIFSALGKKQL